jgi:hypothetical protein
MSQKKPKPNTSSTRGRRPARRARRRLGWLIATMAVLAVVAGGWLVLRKQPAAQSTSALPGPAGGRDVAQDVNTLIGRRAPAFTLATAAGRTYMVTPGRDRPTVLIFHMGLT